MLWLIFLSRTAIGLACYKTSTWLFCLAQFACFATLVHQVINTTFVGSWFLVAAVTADGFLHGSGCHVTQHFVDFFLGAGNLVSESDLVFGFSQCSKALLFGCHWSTTFFCHALGRMTQFVQHGTSDSLAFFATTRLGSDLGKVLAWLA